MEGRPSRIFIAVKLSRDLRDRLGYLQCRLFAGRTDVRVVSVENLHITLRFLGEVEKVRMGNVISACEQTAAIFSRFYIDVRGVGSFPAGNPRILWAGITDGSDTLIEINARLEYLLGKEGFTPDEKPYRPHLTIGRVKPSQGIADLRRCIAAMSDIEIGGQSVDGISLMSSRLGREAPVYTEIAWRPLLN